MLHLNFQPRSSNEILPKRKNMLKSYLSLIAIFFICTVSCKESSEENISTLSDATALTSYNENFRPQFHFSPPEKWMNDPNGLVYNKGTYHLFYQYYPEDIVWGPMHWGHAVSTDMIEWKNKPIALYPDELGMIFSGSAVVDKMNTSGFGTSENPPLVAIFTYHLMEGEKAGRNDFQTQGLAYSLDNGENWQKYELNPILHNDGMRDFRDPKVFWNDESQEWVMVLVAGDHAKFYRSSNLKEWELMSEFGKDKGAHGGVWECPDLIKFEVEGSTEEKWVLLISINPGAPNGGSGTQYFVGDFDGITFTTDQKDERWIDYGMDNYAGVTYNNTPNNEHIFIGWMSNWNYARDTPTEVWRSAMTLARKLSLHKEDGKFVLKNYPLSAFDKLQAEEIERQSSVGLDYPYILEYEDFNKTDISFMADLSKNHAITFSNSIGEQLCLQINGETGELLFDRTRSGIVDFEVSFGKSLQKMIFTPKSKLVEVRLILDRSSIEVFIDRGKQVFTNQVFPKSPYTRFEISGPAGGEIENLTIKRLNSIWHK